MGPLTDASGSAATWNLCAGQTGRVTREQQDAHSARENEGFIEGVRWAVRRGAGFRGGCRRRPFRGVIFRDGA